MKGIARTLLLVIMIVSLFSCTTSAVVEEVDEPGNEYTGLGVGVEVLGSFTDFNLLHSCPVLDVNWLYKDEANVRVLNYSFNIPTVYDHGILGLVQGSGWKLSATWLKAMDSGIMDFLVGGGIRGTMSLVFSAHVTLGMDCQINDKYLLFLLVSPNIYADDVMKFKFHTTLNANLGVVMKYDFKD